jgi:tetratricopeptide (TPR) repeat protein
MTGRLVERLCKTDKLLLVIAFLMAFFVPALLMAQAQLKGGKGVNTMVQKPVTGDTYAIIFGISNYPGLVPLKYADKDAALFRDFLETPAGGNTKAENIFFRTNENAKAADFNYAAWGWVKSKGLKAGDRLYVYFSGHGDAVNAANYFLLPYDCMPNNDVSNYAITGLIEMYHIKTWFIQPLIKKNVEVFLIVDACRTNDLPGGQEGQENFSNSAQSVAEQKDGEIIMLSAGGGQSAIESPKIGGGHGLFTWYLVAGLSGDADKEGDAADNDGKVSFAEISSYVKNRVRKEAKTVYNSDQVPVFLPPDKDLETIAVVDSGTYANWKLAENMRQQTNGTGSQVAVANKMEKKAVAPGNPTDTALIAVDNKFIAAINTGKLSGANSAEDFYGQMKEKWPGQSITGDARYTLATAFINFGQDKINLFLNGKGIVHIQRMENELTAGKNKIPAEIAEQLGRMKTLTETGFDQAAKMMEKAVVLLQSDPELLSAIYPKLYFLQAAASDRVNNVSGKRLAIALLKKAIKKDSTAAYNYLMLGHLLYDLKNDSCEAYFKKAISLAPKWASPENDLANYYGEKENNKLAIIHYQSAVLLDSLDDIAYQNIGVLYTDEKMPDSARKYFLKSLAINPCDQYANCNMAIMSAVGLAGKSMADPKFRLSEKYLKKSLECEPGFSKAYILLAGLFDKLNLKDSSMRVINEGLRKNPNDASLYRMLGDEYFDQHDTLKAEFFYQKGLQVDSMDVGNYFSLIWLYENAALNNSRLFNGEKNAFARALQCCGKALKINPSSAYAYNGMGDINVNLENYDTAVLNYQAALKVDSAFVDAYNGLGNAFYYQQKYDKALLCYKKTTKLNPRYTLGYSSAGDVYFEQGDFNNALSNYQKAIDVDSTYVFAYQRLGYIYSRFRAYRKAAANYQRSLVLEPSNALVYNALGNVFNNLKSYDTAIIYHKKAISLSPLKAHYYNDLAVAYDELNKNDDAITWYKKAIALDSTNELPYANLAAVYFKLKTYDKAIHYLTAALKFNPNDAAIYNGLGNVYREIKDYKNQIYYYKKALDIDSTKTYHLTDLGFAYIRSGNSPDGINSLQKAAKLHPNDAAPYYDLACGYALLNDTVTGMKYLEKALEKGFRDYEGMNGDADLENLKKLPEYAVLMKQYFPGKIK